MCPYCSGSPEGIGTLIDFFLLQFLKIYHLRRRCVPTALPREEGHGLQDAQWHCQPLLWLHLPVKCGVRQKVREIYWYRNIHTGCFIWPSQCWELTPLHPGSWNSWEARWGTTSPTWWTPSRSSARAPRGRWARRRRWSRRSRGWRRRLNYFHKISSPQVTSYSQANSMSTLVKISGHLSAAHQDLQISCILAFRWRRRCWWWNEAEVHKTNCAVKMYLTYFSKNLLHI